MDETNSQHKELIGIVSWGIGVTYLHTFYLNNYTIDYFYFNFSAHKVNVAVVLTVSIR